MRLFVPWAACALVLAPLAPFTWADAALRYHSDIQLAAILSNPELGKALAGAPDMLVRIKGNKAYSSQGHITSIMDLANQQLTLLDAAHKRFATVAATEYSHQMKTAIPAIPEQARSMLASLKTNLESGGTGRSEAIQGIQATERELVLTLEMPGPGGGAGSVPFMKMIMQVWTADPAEARRVPALQEFQNYTASAAYAMNPAVLLEEVVAAIPGLGDDLGKMMAEMSKTGGVALRIHMEIVAPFLNATFPLVQMNQELAELSSDPVDDAIFQIPADFQAAPLDEILKGAASAPPLPQFKP